uniref:C2H2-type domain-containing protein n=5 Tax=Lygus hesperus TaxID=30085 RepID=A0A0K8SG77_LYGHE
MKEEERTIRFPVKNGWNGHYVSDVVCRWMGCEAKFNTSTALLEHLQKIHVDGQTLEEYFYCRWKDCKVFDRKSCSRSWLGRHVLSHGGNKRFACIVEGCGQRFNSQVLLTRHVNGHFVDKDIKKDSKTGCEVNSKLIRRNGKKLRYRREPFSARTQDYIDSGMMEGIQYNLIKVTEKRTLGLFDQVSPDSLVLRSEIIAKRTDPKGISEVLVRWFPKNILEDEWMDPTKVERTRPVKITTLTPESKDCLYEYLWGHQNLSRTPRCRKQGAPHT